jgi:hypothetical protein
MKNNNRPQAVASFFKDKDGNVVIWQWPNLPLASWIIFKLLSMVFKTGHVKTGFESLSMAALFTWAYLEITSGSSYFRRVLGVVIIIGLIFGYFKSS